MLWLFRTLPKKFRPPFSPLGSKATFALISAAVYTQGFSVNSRSHFQSRPNALKTASIATPASTKTPTAKIMGWSAFLIVVPLPPIAPVYNTIPRTTIAITTTPHHVTMSFGWPVFLINSKTRFPATIARIAFLDVLVFVSCVVSYARRTLVVSDGPRRSIFRRSVGVPRCVPLKSHPPTRHKYHRNHHFNYSTHSVAKACIGNLGGCRRNRKAIYTVNIKWVVGERLESHSKHRFRGVSLDFLLTLLSKSGSKAS